MKEIALVMCPCWDVNAPPLGIAYLSQSLKVQGYNCSVFDVNISIFNKLSGDLRDFWHPSKLWCWMDQDFFINTLLPILSNEMHIYAEKIVSLHYPIIGFSVFRSNLRFTIELAKMIKKLEPNAYIIFGGHACNIEGERKLVPKGLVDIFVLGEGELILTRILDSFFQGEELRDLPGCIIKDEGAYANLSSRAVISHLDTIPFPEFKEFILDNYHKRMIPVVGSRGCARRCAFCNDWIVWPNYRFRSAENIFTELLYHINNYTICDFEFVDLAINGKEAELGKLCDLIIANHIKINWVANFLIRPKINAGLFSKLRDAGCNVLRFGIESGSDKILKTMNKPFTIKDAEENLKQSYLAKIENHINLIVGYPGEDDNDFKATLSFVERNREFINRIANVHPCYLTPESELEKKYESYNIILPKESFSTHWYDKSGNTYAQRKARALEVKKLASRLDIQFEDKSALILLDEELAKEEKKFSGSLSKNE